MYASRLLPFGVLIANLPTSAIGIRPFAQLVVPPLTGKISSYQHTIADRYGFESATLVYPGDRSDMVLALGLLGRAITIVAPSGAVMWDGMISRVGISAGGAEHSIGLDAIANRVKVRYTTNAGVPGATSTYQDTTSQSKYGIKDLVQSVGATTAAAAAALAQTLLAERKEPPADVALTLATSGSADAGTITLECVGLYESLGWTVTSNTSTSNTDVLTQIAALVGAAGTNGWITSGTLQPSTPTATEFIAPDTTYRDKVETLLALGDVANRPLSWGVYEDRKFHVDTWAGIPSGMLGISAFGGSRNYRIYMGEGMVRNGENVPVPWWLVRPNIVYGLDLLDIANVSTSNGTTTGVASRVTFSVDASGMQIQLESEHRSSADARLARIG